MTFEVPANDTRMDLPDGAEPLTTGVWHNAFVSGCTRKCEQSPIPCFHTSGWTKHLSHSGSYEQFRVGKAAPPPRYAPGTCGEANRRAGRHEDHDEHGHQAAILLGRRFGYFVTDVDNAELYESEATLARWIHWEDRISESRPGHWHVLIWVPPHLRHLWPDRDVPGANLKGYGDGFVPVPGCWHYSGSKYEPGRRCASSSQPKRCLTRSGTSPLPKRRGLPGTRAARGQAADARSNSSVS